MPKTVKERFYQDPEWYQVEDIIKEFIAPLIDMSTIDTSQPSENVKAEIIGRKLAYDKLSAFLNQAKIIGHSKPKVENSPFR